MGYCFRISISRVLDALSTRGGGEAGETPTENHKGERLV